MYRIRTNRSAHAVPFATLDHAVARLQSLLLALDARGCRIAFNDRLEYEITPPAFASDIHVVWIEDDAGLHVIAEGTTLDC